MAELLCSAKKNTFGFGYLFLFCLNQALTGINQIILNVGSCMRGAVEMRVGK